MKFKVIYKENGKFEKTYFRTLKCALEYAKRMNGIVLNA